MKLKFKIGFVIIATTAASCKVQHKNVLHYVDPNIGTAHSRWFFIHQQLYLMVWQN